MVHVDLVLDVGAFQIAQIGDLNFVVEMADIADNRHVLHFAHVFDADDVLVAGSGDEDVGIGYRVFQRGYFKTVHSGLQRADRIDFGNLDPGTGAAQRSG